MNLRDVVGGLRKVLVGVRRAFVGTGVAVAMYNGKKLVEII